MDQNQITINFKKENLLSVTGNKFILSYNASKFLELLDGKNEIYHSDYLTKYVDEKPDIETDFNFKSDSESYYSDEDQEQKLEEEEEIADSSRKKITFDLNNKDENDEESKKDENEDENKKDENNDKSKEEEDR